VFERDLAFERLTDPVLLALMAARREVRRVSAAQLEPLHLVVGILEQEGDPAARLLAESGVSPESLRSLLEQTGGRPVPEAHLPSFSPETWQAFAYAAARGADISTSDLLAALLRVSMAVRVGIKAAGGSVERLRAGLDIEE